METEKCYGFISSRGKTYLKYFDSDKKETIYLSNGGVAKEYIQGNGILISIASEGYSFCAFYDSRRDDVIWSANGVTEYFLMKEKNILTGIVYKTLNNPAMLLHIINENKKIVVGERLFTDFYVKGHPFITDAPIDLIYVNNSSGRLHCTEVSCKKLFINEEYVLAFTGENVCQAFYHNGVEVNYDKFEFNLLNAYCVSLEKDGFEEKQINQENPVFLSKIHQSKEFSIS